MGTHAPSVDDLLRDMWAALNDNIRVSPIFQGTSERQRPKDQRHPCSELGAARRKAELDEVLKKDTSVESIGGLPDNDLFWTATVTLHCTTGTRNPRSRKFDVSYEPPGGLPPGEFPINSISKLESFVRRSILKARSDRAVAGLEEQPSQAEPEASGSGLAAVGSAGNALGAGAAQEVAVEAVQKPPQAAALGSRCTAILFEIRRIMRKVWDEHGQAPLPEVDHLVNGVINDLSCMGGLKTVTVLFGDNGRGKTMLANLWIQDTITDSLTYMRNHDRIPLKTVLQFLGAFRDMHLLEVQTRGLDSIPSLEPGDIWQVTDDDWQCKAVFEIRGDINTEAEPEQHAYKVKLSVRPENYPCENAGDCWKPFEDFFSSGNLKDFKEGFILPCVEEGRSTTSFTTIVSHDPTVHAIIRHMSLETALHEAQSFVDGLRQRFPDALPSLEDLNDELSVDQDDQLYQQHMTFKLLVSEEHQQISSMDHQVMPAHIREAVREWLGVCHVVAGRGDNLTADRCFVLQHLRDIHKPQEEGTFEYVRHVTVESIRVYVPAGVVAGGGEIHDPPGANDMRVRQQTELHKSLSEADQVVAVMERNLKSEQTVSTWLQESGFLQKMVRSPRDFKLICAHIQKGQVSLGNVQKPIHLETVIRDKDLLDQYFDGMNVETAKCLKVLLKREAQSLARSEQAAVPDPVAAVPDPVAAVPDDPAALLEHHVTKVMKESVKVISPLPILSKSLQLSRAKATSALREIHKETEAEEAPAAFGTIGDVLEYCGAFVLEVLNGVYSRSLRRIEPILRALENGLQNGPVPLPHHGPQHAGHPLPLHTPDNSLPDELVSVGKSMDSKRLDNVLKERRKMNVLGYDHRAIPSLQLDLELDLEHAVDHRGCNDFAARVETWVQANKARWPEFKAAFPLESLSHVNPKTIHRVTKFPLVTFLTNPDRAASFKTQLDKTRRATRQLAGFQAREQLPIPLGDLRLLSDRIRETIHNFMSERESDFKALLCSTLDHLAPDLGSERVAGIVGSILEKHPVIFASLKDTICMTVADTITDQAQLTKHRNAAMLDGVREFIAGLRETHGDDVGAIAKALDEWAESGFEAVYNQMAVHFLRKILDRHKKTIKDAVKDILYPVEERARASDLTLGKRPQYKQWFLAFLRCVVADSAAQGNETLDGTPAVVRLLPGPWQIDVEEGLQIQHQQLMEAFQAFQSAKENRSEAVKTLMNQLISARVADLLTIMPVDNMRQYRTRVEVEGQRVFDFEPVEELGRFKPPTPPLTSSALCWEAVFSPRLVSPKQWEELTLAAEKHVGENLTPLSVPENISNGNSFFMSVSHMVLGHKLDQSDEDARSKAMALRVAAASDLKASLSTHVLDHGIVAHYVYGMFQDEQPVDEIMIYHTCRVLNINCLVLSAAFPEAKVKMFPFRERQANTWIAVAAFGNAKDGLRFAPIGRCHLLPADTAAESGIDLNGAGPGGASWDAPGAPAAMARGKRPLEHSGLPPPTTKRQTTDGARRLVVVDTNAMHVLGRDDAKLLKTLFHSPRYKLAIARAVFGELENQKSRHDGFLSATARAVFRCLTSASPDGRTQPFLLQSEIDFHSDSTRRLDQNQLGRIKETWNDFNDGLILQHAKRLPGCVLVTNDNPFTVKARHDNVECWDAERLVQELAPA